MVVDLEVSDVRISVAYFSLGRIRESIGATVMSTQKQSETSNKHTEESGVTASVDFEQTFRQA
jgi:hypothetical protein